MKEAKLYSFSTFGMTARAVQITPENFEEVAAWSEGEIVDLSEIIVITEGWRLCIRFRGVSGTEWARIGDWMLKYDDDTFYVYPDESFRKFFTLVEEPADV